jgi:hypothetical protein
VGEVELGQLSLVAIKHDVVASPSSPEITYGDTELGRQSMSAVRRELLGSSSAPEIVVNGEATLGRESLAAIDQDGKPRPTSSPESIRIDLVSLPEVELGERLPLAAGVERAAVRGPAASRATVPWVESPVDTKRTTDAAVVGRKLSPPKVTVKLEDADQAVLEAARTEVEARAPHGTIAYGEAPTKVAKP